MKQNKVLSVLWDYFLMTVGSVIFCMAWTSFLIPNGLASGGLTGFCTIVQYGTGIPVGWTYPVLNFMLLILAFFTLGKAFGVKTIYVIALTSVLFEILPKFPQLQVMMDENNDVFTMEDEPIASVMQDIRKGSKWLSAFLESYRPPLDGERYLTDGEVAELLRVSRRTLQEYRNNRVLPFILLGGKVLYPETGLREVLEANYRKPLE